MFDNEKFVLEVQRRVCLWDSREKCYDKIARKRAWKEIAQIMYSNSWDEGIVKQLEILDELQKKWKHLRDYYVKIKKQERIRGGGSAKRRKNSCIDMLNFLDVLQGPQILAVNINVLDEDSMDLFNENIKEEPSTSTTRKIHNQPSSQSDSVPGTSHVTEMPRITAYQDNFIDVMNEQHSTAKDDDPDTQFLLSLLPQVKSLNERQNLEFKMEVMNLIYKIKYLSDS